jgi:uncharacterized Zn finger protein (UPF0148 family)
MFLMRDLECSRCKHTFEALVPARKRDGARVYEGCPACDAPSARVILTGAKVCPTLDVTSEAFERATTQRAREHDRKVARPEYFERRNMRVPRDER